MKIPVLLLTYGSGHDDRIASILERYDVVTCARVAEAAALCRDHTVSLLIVTHRLAEGSGIEAFTGLRADMPELAGLLLADRVDRDLLTRALDAGFSGVMELPPDPQRLNERVERLMRAASLQAENTRLRTLLPLYSLGEQFLASSTEEEVLEGFLDAVVEQTGAAHVSVMLYDPDEACLRIAAARGMDQDLVHSIRLQPGDQIAGWVFAKGKPVILNRDTQDQSIFAPLLKRPEITSAISFPLTMRGKILGVLNISQTDGDSRFSEADIEMLGVICSQAAMALENVRAIMVVEQTTRMRTLFEQYVSPEVAELLIASDANLMGLGEIKEVTVLFADIRNFTRLVQHLQLAELRSFLNEFFQLFTETIFRCRGTVDKFMGDAVLAVFGAPIALDNANLTAVRAALAIRRRFEDLRLRWAHHGEDFRTIDLGIAITCGRVFLGNVGSSQRLDYTVIGNQVNIAQRLAAESSSCQIYITEPVRSAIRQEVEVEDLGEMELRGVEKNVPVFSVRGERE
ncbi:MAG TPA: GAF domain-containing protein [Desulfobulbus sp.]|nr:GAF domain-containing protein [Desulfobulbus sp.]